MPCDANSTGGPTPDNMRSCGDPTAPAATITSRRARTAPRPPFSFILQADGTLFLEQDPCCMRAG